MGSGILLIAAGWFLLLSPLVCAALMHAWRRRKRPLHEDFPELSEGE